MFKLIISSLIFSVSANEWLLFNNFQHKFLKMYSSFNEMKNRFEIFKNNLQFINEHNSNTSHSFTLGINKFSDLTEKEFKSFVNNGINKPNLLFGLKCGTYSVSGDIVRSSVDYRNEGRVTPVKSQLQCGSCWAFSTTGSVEGQLSKNGPLISLSEQQLVDCSTLNSGCNGGLMDIAMIWIKNNGICSEESYPYLGKDGSCQKCEPIAKISNCLDIPENNQVLLKDAISSQTPVSIALSADSIYFQHYSKGVLNSGSCYTELNHGVLIVGYGEENGEKYWLVKNSWGEDWGEDGYIRIERSDSVNDPGICGIAMSASFPVA